MCCIERPNLQRYTEGLPEAVVTQAAEELQYKLKTKQVPCSLLSIKSQRESYAVETTT